MIITSGYNVYPAHIEEILMKHPSVLNCAIIGIPDQNKGEIVKAFIVLKENNSKVIAKGNIQKYLKKQLAKYEQPREYTFIDEIPKTNLGKIAYKELEKIN